MLLMLCRGACLRHIRNELCRANVNRYQNFVTNWVHFGILIVIFVKISSESHPLPHAEN